VIQANPAMVRLHRAVVAVQVPQVMQVFTYRNPMPAVVAVAAGNNLTDIQTLKFITYLLSKGRRLDLFVPLYYV
jgi:hypothetical protein